MATGKQNISGQEFWTDWGSLQSKTRQDHGILEIP